MRHTLLLLAAIAATAVASPPPRVSEANGLLNTTAGSASPTQKYAAAAGAADACVYGWLLCYADAVLLPTSTAELASTLTTLSAASPAPPLAVRASSSVFHSTAPFVCPYAYGGGLGSPIPLHAPAPPPVSLPAPTSVVVVQDALRGVVRVDVAARTITVLAGSRLWQVWGWAADAGLSPPRGVASAWADLSVGGAVAAAMHGAGTWSTPSGINDIVIDYVWVDAAGTVHVSPRSSPAGNAIAGGVGTIGIVTEVTLQLEPLSKTVATTTTALPDAGLAGEVAGLAAVAGNPAAPNVALLWRPDAGVYNRYELKDGGPASKPSTWTTGPSFTGNTPPLAPQLVGAYVTTVQADANDTNIGALLGPASCASNVGALAAQQWAATMHGALPLPVGAGITNFMVTNWADPKAAPWSAGLAVDEIGFAIEAADFAAWVADVRAIIDADLGGGKVRCTPIGTLLIRFAQPVDADVAMTAGMSRPVVWALAMLRSRKLADVPAKYSWVQDYIEQLTLCRYRGRPHWGKNFARTFTNPACPVRDLYGAGFDRLLTAQAAYDPNKVFETPLFAAVVARGGPLYDGPGCATQKLCYCTRDDQCADGWACAPSRAFPQYRACVPAGLKWRA